jgi:hypothetical protein
MRIFKISLGILFSVVACCHVIHAQSSFFEQLSDAVLSLTKQDVQYDPSYFSIKYPNGDVPSNKGVCTDVVIRAYRMQKIDLQSEVHEDMKNNFKVYPAKWGMKTTDTNIDHRRVPRTSKILKK